MANDAKFDEVRALGLSPGQYVITASGPMGIRGIRDIDDVDLLVVDALFDELAKRYPSDGSRIRISPTIEAFSEYAFPSDPSVPGLAEQVAHAELIDGLPFVRLEDLIKLKTAQGREKDLRDIDLIRAWQAANPGS
jgi:hypothetical protein